MATCTINFFLEATVNVYINVDVAAVIMIILALINQYHNHQYHNRH